MPASAFSNGDLISEGAMDRLISLACASLGCTRGLISVFGPEQTVFQAAAGIDIAVIQSDVSVTRLLMEMGPEGLLVFEDGLKDPRVCRHPLVVGEPFLRFYAGATIVDTAGEPIGAISVMDVTPRGPLSELETLSLRRLARMAGDLIEQASAARRSREQVALLKMSEQLSGVGHWRFDLLSQKVTWSDEVYRIHAAPEGFDPSYDGAASRYVDEDEDMLRAAVSRAIETGEGYELNLRLKTFDGRQRKVVAKATTERDESGAVSALFGVFQDVTDAAEAQARLEASEAAFRLLTEGATDLVTRYSTDGVFIYVSPAVENILGYRPDEMIGRKGKDFILAEDMGLIYQALGAYATAGPQAPPPRYEYRARRKDGSIAWLEATPRGVFDEAGKLIELNDHVRDVTERKALEAELIAERDRAEAAARVKSEFLANMSHELRTPLTSVIGFSGLLLSSENLRPVERRFADRIATASESLLAVINDILDYSKLEAQAVELDPAPFSPRAMAEAAAAIVDSQATAKGLSLAVDIGPGMPETLMGDEARLRQVALNFLSNAVKFTPEGGVRLNLRWRDGRMRLEVIDTGIGAEPDKIEALFERFTQADTSTTRTYGGTGLGLAISRRIIELMGGEIGATSAPGEGSTFWFEAPLDTAEAVQSVSEPATVVDIAGLRVLMADDASANRELVSTLLRQFGVEVETAEDGVQAVQTASAGGFDLILMDMNMPNMDGLDATRAIRSLGGAASEAPIIALCRAAGMNGHVGKPIQLTALVAEIRSVLNIGQRDCEAAA